jgi:hypothetical protein
MNSNKIKQIFQDMAKTITQSGEFGPAFQALPSERLFDRESLLRGDTLLWGEAARASVKACDDVTAIATNEQIWSRSSVDETLSRCLSSVLHAGSEKRAEALRTEASEILRRFTEQPREWAVDLFVNGMDVSCAELTFGRLAFHLAPVNIPPHVQKNMSLHQPNSLMMARIKTTSVDEQSAIERARKSLEEHLGALNALCSQGLPSDIRLSHASHVAQTYSIYRAGIVGDEPGEIAFQPVQNRFPLVRQVFLEAMDKRGGEQVGRMLSKPPSEFSDRVLSGYVLAGGACVDPWPERSFLLFAIALERVALGNGTRSEITHQLATRVAHLIGGNFEGRRDVARQMSRLYDRRSHIVHEGEIGVANDEMFLMYLYCMTTLHVLVLSPAFSEMKANADLERWFSDRILEGPSHYDPKTAADHS